ncbi:hypothetical protein GA0070612_2798 [Micromonospora chokoriensis]|uniref:Uncharacterized protein n=1 Tax=Micromonospora chokoriensis TaxID=356851 RepID=A0A1C4WSV9_9ACTN|nr:hypothetical protein GA0070612_2798 [Micromonospora chokoriensis]
MPDGEGETERFSARRMTLPGGRSAHQDRTAKGRPSASTVRPVTALITGVQALEPASTSIATISEALIRRAFISI